MARTIRDPRYTELLMKRYFVRLGIALGGLDIVLHVAEWVIRHA